jgi:hypothetical protein
LFLIALSHKLKLVVDFVLDRFLAAAKAFDLLQGRFQGFAQGSVCVPESAHVALVFVAAFV